jgi:hypothetical protein
MPSSAVMAGNTCSSNLSSQSRLIAENTAALLASTIEMILRSSNSTQTYSGLRNG